ncbi:DUF1499 domain-containing protein [Allohahella marinimesophila]|uniref:DUF1499 domain-containing protein n=1 Tax=Allohahella marinimesophila TaxID=1054972 RepID=A0ABP7NLV0_9GAMM
MINVRKVAPFALGSIRKAGHKVGAIASGLGLAAILGGCSGTPPSDLGVEGDRLKPCPDKPNCVNSFASKDDTDHHIQPLAAAQPQQTWQMLQTLISETGNATIVSQSEGYMRVEYKSSLFGFVDDVEFLLAPEAKQIDVRSASRMGYSDLGVNRERIDEIRAALADK